ncbi:hypothetical protein Tco_0419067 [Tanacetum coccineum]
MISCGRSHCPCRFFSTIDLEYLRWWIALTKESITTSQQDKAAKYEIEGIEDMVPKVSRHDVYSTMRILSVTSVTVDKWYGISFEERFLLDKSRLELYKFMEGDLKTSFEIIDTCGFLLFKNRLNNLGGNVISTRAVALLMYTRRIVLYKRVEDLQVGVESYQKKLNIPNPWTHDVDLSCRALYTTLSEPQGVIYEDKLKRKRLMRTKELYKFSDGSLLSS